MKVSEKRTQVYFPSDLYNCIGKKAKEESKSAAAIIRDAVRRYLAEKKPDWEKDSFFNIVGIAESGAGDLSQNHDKYLYGFGFSGQAGE